MCKIGIVGFLLVALVLLSGCVPATTPPPVSPPTVAPPQEPAPPVEVPPKEITPTPYPTESSAPTLTVPKAPSNLTGDTVSQDSYTLYWADNSDNEEGFRIYRNNSLIATVGMNIKTYQDTDLEPSTCCASMEVGQPALGKNETPLPGKGIIIKQEGVTVWKGIKADA